MKSRLSKDGTLLFWCPGCDEPHGVPTSKWEWNGSEECPTLNPSILVRSNRYGPDKLKFGKYEGLYPCELTEFRCHSFVRNGYIEYCSDCDHELANQIVELPDFDSIR